MNNTPEYASFWHRAAAFFLDIIIWLPITGFSIWGSEQSRLFNFYWLVPGFIIAFLFHVYLVKRFGGSPGKLLMNIRITKLDGSAVDYKAAFLRYAVVLFASLILAIMFVQVTLTMSDAEYFAIAQVDRSLQLIDRTSVWYTYISIAMTIWIYSEFIVMLTNQKRRALQDYMAGTMVIKWTEQANHVYHRSTLRSRNFDYKNLARN